jgi:hypothetical protein
MRSAPFSILHVADLVIVFAPLVWTILFLTKEMIFNRSLAIHGRSRLNDIISPIALLCWIAAPLLVLMTSPASPDWRHIFVLSSVTSIIFAVVSIPALLRVLRLKGSPFEVTTLVPLLLFLWIAQLPYSWALVTVIDRAG